MSFALKETELKASIVTAIVTIILTITLLHLKGYLNHSTATDAATIETFKLLSLKPGYEQAISSKKADKVAFCTQGYLLVRSQIQQESGGILVDARNRPIPCQEATFEK